MHDAITSAVRTVKSRIVGEEKGRALVVKFSVVSVEAVIQDPTGSWDALVVGIAGGGTLRIGMKSKLGGKSLSLDRIIKMEDYPSGITIPVDLREIGPDIYIHVWVIGKDAAAIQNVCPGQMIEFR